MPKTPTPQPRTRIKDIAATSSKKHAIIRGRARHSSAEGCMSLRRLWESQQFDYVAFVAQQMDINMLASFITL
jgi:hypothetical protein